MHNSCFTVFPKEAIQTWWRNDERLLLHVLVIAALLSDHEGDQEWVGMVRRAEEYLYRLARYEQAESCFSAPYSLYAGAVMANRR
jgi:hypothetical protein